jgi:hypothetical protein
MVVACCEIEIAQNLFVIFGMRWCRIQAMTVYSAEMEQLNS